MPAPIAPVTLSGRTIRLEPLTLAHASALATVADPALFRWYTIRIDSPADMTRWVEDAINSHAAGTALPFAIVRADGDRVIGSTRFMNVSQYDGRYEIGSTWIATDQQRTAANTEAKYLMLRHAFETLGARRVELKTHAQNAQSRRAIERLGARFEGTHRNHMLMYDGTMRDTVWYSIIDSEWRHVKARLESRLETGMAGPSGVAGSPATAGRS